MKSTCTLLIGFALGVLTLGNHTEHTAQLGALVILLMALALLLIEHRAEKRDGRLPAGWTITHAPRGQVVIVSPDGTGVLVRPGEDTTTGRQLHRLTSAMKENAPLIKESL